MDKLRVIKAPFNYQYSSCSRFAPKKFKWSISEGIATIWIDYNIFGCKGEGENNFGWICESSEIVSNLKKEFLLNFKVYKPFFKNIFTCDYEIIALDPEFFIYNPPGSNLPWTPKSDYRVPNKTKICSMICSTKCSTTGQKLRLEVAEKWKGWIGDKDSFCIIGGACGTIKSGNGFGPYHWWRSKEEFLAPYRFSLVFENSKYNKYYTEKITDCFALGVIPVYWGTDLISEDFNEHGIIKFADKFDFSLLTEELYEAKKEYVLDNLKRVEKLESADDTLYKQILGRI